jgi:hypothetical protein
VRKGTLVVGHKPNGKSQFLNAGVLQLPIRARSVRLRAHVTKFFSKKFAGAINKSLGLLGGMTYE